MIDIKGEISSDDILCFDVENLGNIYIMDKLTFNRIQHLKDYHWQELVKYFNNGPQLLACKIVFTKGSCFMKGVM